MKNKKGQIMLSVLFAIVIFIFGMLFYNFIKGEVDNTRTDLTCSSSATISDGTKLTCLIVDGVIPYFIILVVSLSLGIVLERLLI